MNIVTTTSTATAVGGTSPPHPHYTNATDAWRGRNGTARTVGSSSAIAAPHIITPLSADVAPPSAVTLKMTHPMPQSHYDALMLLRATDEGVLAIVAEEAERQRQQRLLRWEKEEEGGAEVAKRRGGRTPADGDDYAPPTIPQILTDEVSKLHQKLSLMEQYIPTDTLHAMLVPPTPEERVVREAERRALLDGGEGNDDAYNATITHSSEANRSNGIGLLAQYAPQLNDRHRSSIHMPTSTTGERALAVAGGIPSPSSSAYAANNANYYGEPTCYVQSSAGGEYARLVATGAAEGGSGGAPLLHSHEFANVASINTTKSGSANDPSLALLGIPPPHSANRRHCRKGLAIDAHRHQIPIRDKGRIGRADAFLMCMKEDGVLGAAVSCNSTMGGGSKAGTIGAGNANTHNQKSHLHHHNHPQYPGKGASDMSIFRNASMLSRANASRAHASGNGVCLSTGHRVVVDATTAAGAATIEALNKSNNTATSPRRYDNRQVGGDDHHGDEHIRPAIDRSHTHDDNCHHNGKANYCTASAAANNDNNVSSAVGDISAIESYKCRDDYDDAHNHSTARDDVGSRGPSNHHADKNKTADPSAALSLLTSRYLVSSKDNVNGAATVGGTLAMTSAAAANTSRASTTTNGEAAVATRADRHGLDRYHHRNTHSHRPPLPPPTMKGHEGGSTVDDTINHRSEIAWHTSGYGANNHYRVALKHQHQPKQQQAKEERPLTAYEINRQRSYQSTVMKVIGGVGAEEGEYNDGHRRSSSTPHHRRPYDPVRQSQVVAGMLLGHTEPHPHPHPTNASSAATSPSRGARNVLVRLHNDDDSTHYGHTNRAAVAAYPTPSSSNNSNTRQLYTNTPTEVEAAAVVGDLVEVPDRNFKVTQLASPMLRADYAAANGCDGNMHRSVRSQKEFARVYHLGGY